MNDKDHLFEIENYKDFEIAENQYLMLKNFRNGFRVFSDAKLLASRIYRILRNGKGL